MATRVAKGAKSEPRSDEQLLPRVIWTLLSRELVSDKETSSVSAINIVEEITLPPNVFRDSDELNLVSLRQEATLCCYVDWLWPVEISHDIEISVKIDWHTPSGKTYVSGAGPDDEPLRRPRKGHSTRIQMKIAQIPIHNEGIYRFEIMLNDVCKAVYPIRITAEKKDKEPAAAKQKKAAAKKAKA